MEIQKIVAPGVNFNLLTKNIISYFLPCQFSIFILGFSKKKKKTWVEKSGFWTDVDNIWHAPV